jgi:hypothetical protein
MLLYQVGQNILLCQSNLVKAFVHMILGRLSGLAVKADA